MRRPLEIVLCALALSIPIACEAQAQSQTNTQAPSAPQTTDWTDRISLSGKGYIRYSYTLGRDGDNFNEFAIDRLYLTSGYQLSDTLLATVTLEAGGPRENGGTGYFDVATKYFYLEAKDLGFEGAWFRVGIIPLAWVRNQEQLWGLRVQGKLFLDRFGYVSSSDLGIAYGGDLPSHFGSFQVDVANGESWTSPELWKRKDVEARLTVFPLASLGGPAANVFITGFAHYGFYDDAGFTARSRQRYVAQVGYQSENVTIAAEIDALDDPTAALAQSYIVGPEPIAHGTGYSVFGVLGLGVFSQKAQGWELFARVDHLDPDDSIQDNAVGLLIGGVGWRWNEHVLTILDYQANLSPPSASILTNRLIQLQMDVAL